MNLLDALNPYRWLLLAALAATLLLAGAAFKRHYDAGQQEIGRNEIRATCSRERETQKDEALRQAQANARETFRRLERQQESQREREDDIRRALADRDRARAAADGLQRDLDAFRAAAAAGGAAGDPAAGRQCPAADAALGVLADLLRRADERAGKLAEFADAAHAAGKQCQRDYQALTPTR